MEDDGLNMQNWGYYEPSYKAQLGLQLMPSLANRDIKPFVAVHNNPILINPNAAFHHQDYMLTEPTPHMGYTRDRWMNMNLRDKFIHMVPPNPNFTILPELPHQTQFLQIADPVMDSRMLAVEDSSVKMEGDCSGSLSKRTGGNTTKAPKAKKAKSISLSKEYGNGSLLRIEQPKKNMDIVINGTHRDISSIPLPVCSCTGTPQQCYRWGCGGWQSACCTTTISMYPLPMSTKRRGARIAGRKMSQGAFKKVLEKLVAEDYSFANPIDLRTHWAKHGTNKFVTVRKRRVWLRTFETGEDAARAYDEAAVLMSNAKKEK